MTSFYTLSLKGVGDQLVGVDFKGGKKGNRYGRLIQVKNSLYNVPREEKMNKIKEAPLGGANIKK